MVLAFIDIIPERDIGKSFFLYIKFNDLLCRLLQLALNDELAIRLVRTSIILYLFNGMNESNQFQGN